MLKTQLMSLLGVRGTCPFAPRMSAFDPKPTFNSYRLRVSVIPPRQDAEGRARRKLADCDVTVSRLAWPEITSIQGVLVVPACKVLLIGACRAPLLAPKLLLAGRTNEGR